MNLTDFDKKILFELDKDGRTSFSEIARVINSTPQVVKYHVEQLQEKGIIRHFWALTDNKKSDYDYFWNYWLKFSGLSKEKEAEMFADFNSNKFIPTVMRSEGYADATIAIIAKDSIRHNEILQDIFNKYGSFITQYDIFVGLGFEKFPRSYLVNRNNELQKFSLSRGAAEKIRLSETDRKIISLLQQDGRIEFTKIAQILGVSIGLVHKHFNRLKKSGVINKIACNIDHQKIGLLLYRVLFRIAQFDQQRTDDLYEFCCLHQNIINYAKGIGNWELMLDIEVENRDAVRNIIREIKYHFKDIIRQVEINEIYQMDKFTQMAVEYPELIDQIKIKINKISLK